MVAVLKFPMPGGGPGACGSPPVPVFDPCVVVCASPGQSAIELIWGAGVPGGFGYRLSAHGGMEGTAMFGTGTCALIGLLVVALLVVPVLFGVAVRRMWRPAALRGRERPRSAGRERFRSRRLLISAIGS